MEKKATLREVSPLSNRMISTFPTWTCCNKPQAVEMTLQDIHRIATHLNMSLESFYDQYCTPFINPENNGPLAVTLKENNCGQCPFKVSGKCSLGDIKPFDCRIAPMVRTIIHVEGRNDAWRIAYFLIEGEENIGVIKQMSSEFLAEIGAADTEVAFGHLKLALIEAYKTAAEIYDLTGKAFDRKTMENEIRRLMTHWNTFGDLNQNAVSNRKVFFDNLVAYRNKHIRKFSNKVQYFVD